MSAKAISSLKSKKPAVILGKKKIVSIDALLAEDDEKPSQTAPVAKKAAKTSKPGSAASSSDAQRQSNKRKQTEPSAKPTTKGNTDEIDDIFGGMKAAKQAPKPAHNVRMESFSSLTH